MASISSTLTDALEGVTEWVIVMKPDGTVEWSNRAFRDFTGPAVKPGTPLQFRQVFPALAPGLMEDFLDMINSGSGGGTWRQITRSDGQRMIVRFSVVPVRKGTELNSMIVYGYDITDQIEMEQFKKDAYGQIEKNIEQFAILGDHLRNPLTAIIGLCDLLEDKTIAAKIHARAQEIDELINRIDRGWIESEKVRNIIKKYYDIGATGTHELVARAMHEEYIEQQRAAGATPDTNPSMLPWNELPHRLKDSNLRQADDIWKKLNLIGCAIGLAITGREPPVVFTPEEIELLAQKEHERWVDERIKKGWRYSKVRNDQERVHDCLVPWEDLPESQREKDRNAIRTLPEILAKVHLRIIRLSNS